MTNGVETLSREVEVEETAAPGPARVERSMRDAVYDLQVPWLFALLPLGTMLTAGVLLIALAIYTR
jgi:hypothetical protein